MMLEIDLNAEQYYIVSASNNYGFKEYGNMQELINEVAENIVDSTEYDKFVAHIVKYYDKYAYNYLEQPESCGVVVGKCAGYALVDENPHKEYVRKSRNKPDAQALREFS